VAISWDATGRVPAQCSYDDGLTVALRFSDASLVRSAAVDASAIGRSSALPLAPSGDANVLSIGIGVRTTATGLVHLPYRVATLSGSVLSGTIPVRLEGRGELSPELRTLLSLPYLGSGERSNSKDDAYFARAAVCLNATLASLARRPGSRVLDVGAGTGWAARHFAARGHWTVALDLSPDYLDTANHFLCLTDVSFDRVVADGDTLPFADRSFDLVFGSAVLHHAVSMPRLLRELGRMVAPGGRIVLVAESLRPIWQSEAAGLRQAANEIELGINEHCPTAVGYKLSCLRAGLRSVLQSCDSLLAAEPAGEAPPRGGRL
jgi:SAM-dependent methyltransferase